MNVDFTLTIKGTVALNGLSSKEIERNLWQLVNRAMSEGLVTGYSEAEVENYESFVVVGKEESSQ